MYQKKKHLFLMKLMNQRGGANPSTSRKTIYFTLHFILQGRSSIKSNTLFEAIRKVLTNLLVFENKQDFNFVFFIVKFSAVFFLNYFLMCELRAVTLSFILVLKHVNNGHG